MAEIAKLLSAKCPLIQHERIFSVPSPWSVLLGLITSRSLLISGMRTLGKDQLISCIHCEEKMGVLLPKLRKNRDIEVMAVIAELI